ncbi:hypothetical protein ZIOFF_059679 [Zingiber officinale]|uniref:UBN2_3 domain-containing protein n=1 Tax=Zingiber officinale TaxID=94328 RepID=A0A8J5FL63_ZINOF|nr:hypothetical protein ZIOFF_059679 [Zingiber officinale]
MICDVPELRGDNYKIWKERTLLHLGCKDVDYAIRKDEPPPENIALYEKWERSNHLSIMFIKTKISDGIRGSLEHYDNVRDLLKAIDDQFVSSDKALASTLIHQFSSMKLSGIHGVHPGLGKDHQDTQCSTSTSRPIVIVHNVPCVHAHIEQQVQEVPQTDPNSVDPEIQCQMTKKPDGNAASCGFCLNAASCYPYVLQSQKLRKNLKVGQQSCSWSPSCFPSELQNSMIRMGHHRAISCFYYEFPMFVSSILLYFFLLRMLHRFSSRDVGKK